MIFNVLSLKTELKLGVRWTLIMQLLECNPRIVGANVTLVTFEKRLAQKVTWSEHLFLHFNFSI